MAELKIKINDIMPKVRGAGDNLDDTRPSIGPLETGPSVRGIWYGACDTFEKAINEAGLEGYEITIPIPDIPSQPPPSEPAPPPSIDPLVALEQIAQAINKAEEILNLQSLVIATANVEAEMDVNVGGVAGAHAKIMFNIAPKPYE